VGSSLPTTATTLAPSKPYLGHRSIMSTVRYTALTPNRFKNFGRISRYIENVHFPLALGGASERMFWRWPQNRVAPHHIRVSGRSITLRDKPEPVPLHKNQVPEVCFANARRILQDRIENRLQIAGR